MSTHTSFPIIVRTGLRPTMKTATSSENGAEKMRRRYGILLGQLPLLEAYALVFCGKYNAPLDLAFGRSISFIYGTGSVSTTDEKGTR